MATVLCIPQWQGSSAPDASRLKAGARRTAELVPADVELAPIAAARAGLAGLAGPVYLHVDLDVDAGDGDVVRRIGEAVVARMSA